jgi:hypothetical protein
MLGSGVMAYYFCHCLPTPVIETMLLDAEAFPASA